MLLLTGRWGVEPISYKLLVFYFVSVPDFFVFLYCHEMESPSPLPDTPGEVVIISQPAFRLDFPKLTSPISSRADPRGRFQSKVKFRRMLFCFGNILRHHILESQAISITVMIKRLLSWPCYWFYMFICGKNVSKNVECCHQKRLSGQVKAMNRNVRKSLLDEVAAIVTWSPHISELKLIFWSRPIR